MKTKKSPLVLTAIALAFALAFTACPIGPEPVPPNPVHVHQWGDWSVTTAATCSLAGVETRTCALDTSHTETQIIPIDPNAHVPGSNSTITKAATCEEDGVWSGTCALNSSHVLNNAVLSKLGHVWEWTTTTATDTTDGQEGYICKNDSSHTKDNQIAYATGTAGLAYEAIGSPATAYRVKKGTVTTGAVHIPAYYRPDANSPYLPVTEIGASDDYPGNGAFQGTNITSVTFASNSQLKSISYFAFASCRYLTSITIPQGVTSISECAFIGTSLTGVTIPASVTSIGQEAFGRCTSLTSVIFAENSQLKTIGIQAFYFCTGLASITIPASVTSIGKEAFVGCTGLASITVDAGNPNYSSEGGILYNKAKTTLIAYPSASGSFTIPGSVTSIGESAFSGTSLTSVTIPTSVTSIGREAFEDCTGITSITIPASVTSVGLWAFDNWTASQTINVQGHANQAAADAAWGTGWRVFFSATINYNG